MIHRILTCKHHPDLRWSSKAEAVGGDKPGDPARYNGARNIFFKGVPSDRGMFSDNSGLDCDMTKDGKLVFECPCPSSDLIIAPEDPLVKRY
jgi:hypothetical protein